MERKIIPRFNQDIELPLIIYIVKKNLLWIIGVLIVLLALSFVYLRYTTPRYESSTILQLTEDETKIDFFKEEQMGNNSIAKDIELLRSQVFIQRIIDSLPLEITYYNKGIILNYDNYTAAPYHVKFIDISPTAYGVPMFIKFTSTNGYNLKYKIGKQKFEFDFILGKPQQSPHFNLLVTMEDTALCLKPSNPFYFIYNNSSSLLDQFTTKLKVQVLSEAARTIKVSFTDINAFRASEVANRVAKEFANFNLEKKREGVGNVISYIDNTLEHLQINLNQADSGLTSFMQEHNIVEDNERDNPIQNKNIDLVRQLENQKFEFEIQLMVLNDVIANVNKKDLDIYEILTQISQLKADGYVFSIVNTINALISKKDRLKTKLTDNHPEIIEVNSEIEVQRKLLIKSLEAIKVSTQSKISELQGKINQIEQSYQIGGANLPYQMEYMQKKRFFEVNQSYYDLLIQKRVEYDLMSKSYTPGYRVLQYSTPASTPIYPRKLFILVGVFVVWFLIAFVGLTISYLSYDKILAIDHITRYCNVAVLGTVAKYDSDIPVSQLVVDKKPKSLIAESFRNIRTNLDFISNEPGSKIIAVTSTISGEGKTFVSINLGGILAYAGKKVIIIDADMRKPKIHLGFNVSNDNGLSNLLIARTTLEESINHSTLDNLHFITAGPIPPNPSELLLGQRMTDIIATLQKEYDYVLIDNPPIGIVTDSMTLLQRADYPIYVFRAGVSRKFFINYLQKLILDNKFKNLSFVLNGMDMKKSSQYGYGNYGYTTSGYGYYEEDNKKFSFKINRKKKKK